MLYLVAILCPPLALLFHGQFGGMLVNLVLCIVCACFLWFPPIALAMYILPIAHACVRISSKEADRRDERLVKAMAAGQAAAAANAKK